MSDCFICVRTQAFKLSGKSSFQSRATVSSVINAKVSSVGKLNLKPKQLSGIKNKQSGYSKTKSFANIIGNSKLSSSGFNGKIKGWLQSKSNGLVRASSKSTFSNKYTDKFAGHISGILSIKDYASLHKLYPISDEVISLNNSYFVNKELSPEDLYDSIDEGIFTGNYVENFNKSNRLTDDSISYIQPSSVFTSGTFRYKCGVNRPVHHPKNSFLFIRAAAPTSNYGANIPPEYRIHNIVLEDPSGNTIIKYKDISLKGDADYSSNIPNYVTYITEPEVNNTDLHSWDANYPILSEPSGYKLNLDFDVICLDDPFNEGFNFGYEEKACDVKLIDNQQNNYLALDGSPLSTQSQGYSLNPTNTIRISAIEICNSGDLCSYCSVTGIKLDNYFGFYTEVDVIGQRLSRTLYPVELLTNSYNIGVYPEAYTLWETSEYYLDEDIVVADNSSASGSKILTGFISNSSNSEYITLSQTSPIVDSGRLSLRFSHEPPKGSYGLRDGEFSLANDKSFNTAKIKNVQETDSFFVVDSIELKVVAKKAVGSRNYSLDVVGYSDDKILNITPKIGAFLQNTNIGSGTIPLTSGFYNTNELALSSESISDKSQYYEKYLTSIDAGDHYVLSSLPVIDSTDFTEYTIPLTIYEDYVDVGKSIDYSLSSFFENLYIDIFPIPSGASIANVKLIIKYRPSNGLMLHTFGTPSSKELGIKDVTLLPVGWDGIALNSNIDDGPISIIDELPQGYKEPLTLKTNYSRRWRGVDGNIVDGPYDPNQFDFSYLNESVDHPFLHSYYDFTNLSGNYILSDNFAHSGLYGGSNSIVKNIGLRYKTEQLFGNSMPYSTIDWTQIGDELYGKISDAYDSALILDDSDLVFESLANSDGFVAFVRFTPIVIEDNGIFSDDSESFIVYIDNDNRLSLDIKDDSNNWSTFNDSKSIFEYVFPLSLVLVYEPNDETVKLYARNEITDDEDLIISANSLLASSTGNFYVFQNNIVNEVGLSTSGNLVEESPNRLLKQTSVSSFLDGHGHSFNPLNNKFKLHSYVDDSVSSWSLGDFKSCSFSPDFKEWTVRIGKDYLVHKLAHSGSGYSQLTDLPLPSSISTSELCYHSQIENDFLRFNLQDIPDANPQFYSAQPRICKTLPRGYDFAEQAFSVDTIIEHETNNDIVWSDGSIGPKLIVSLYSKHKEPVDRPSKVNWGLINRSSHYLKPSGCYEKLTSTFNYNDLFDTTEPWANFDLDNIISEFDQKYYSSDINDMILQYDIAYPSGSPFNSIIKIHSANVRLKDSLTYWADNSGTLNLYSSGESIRYTDLNLYTYGRETIVSSLDLSTNGSYWPNTNDSVNLFASGSLGVPNASFNLFVKNSGIVSELGPDLYVLAGEHREELSIPLVMIDNTLDQTRTSSVNLIVRNTEPILSTDSLTLSMGAAYSKVDLGTNSRMNLVTHNDQVLVYNTNNNFNLYINTDLGYETLDNSFNLFTINYLAYNQNVNQQSSISWNVNNLGVDIDPILDADVPFLDPNDTIRGVDLSCFGNCDSLKPCNETAIRLHDIDWYGENSCIDGGIFRVKNTYTNLAVSGFNTNVGYSGNFYGIKKYTGLVPNAPYDITVCTKTGVGKSITLPTQFVELDYGSNENVNYSGVKLAADKDLDDSERQAGNKFGKSVAVRNDLIAVGAPMQTVSYSEYDSSGNIVTTNLSEAGSVFLYRRDSQPSGITWLNGDKGDWHLESKITLPSGLLKDYPTIIQSNEINGIPIPEPISRRYWNVGQDGRQFGHSVALAVNENLSSFEESKREILVVGGPSSKWNRDFDDLNVSGVSVGLIVFTDEFRPSYIDQNDPERKRVIGYGNVLQAIANKDLVFRYFCDPPVKFDVKVIICEPISSFTNTQNLDFPEPKPPFIVKQRIPRNVGIVDDNDKLAVFSGIKNAFDTAFPYDESKINNNIPCMLGVYVDNSRSLGRKAVSPGLDEFLSYYKQYSFASGLYDFFGTQSSGSIYEYNASMAGSEDWINLSIIALNNLLDTGRLVLEDQVRFFASNVGVDSFNENLTEFNYPPNSGGRVYVFEKESGAWNLVQEIRSPNISYDIPDRFGHAVAISKDSKIISIGSPYIHDCCKILQYNPQEKNRLFNGLYSWLNYQNSLLGGDSLRYLQLLDDYAIWLDEYGYNYANSILYSNLTSTEKFQARQYLNINEYSEILNYTYDSIPYVGNDWDLIPRMFAPTSRLGYSTAVNEDGSIVAFGAPTDSFNAFDDYNVYYKNNGYNDPLNIDSINGVIKPAWKSNVNAGAVRLFESRNYYPHNKAIEFGKFGNLHQSLGDPLDSGHFGYLANIFSDKSFRKTTESEVSIPEDVGLTFIITPGEDILNNEIIDNISSWLSLGDRNLVLVGNDPIWESSGIYNQSNNIINKLLSALNSKVRLHPARNEYESLPSGNSKVIPSFRPANGTPSYVRSEILNTARGVGDIRMHMPNFTKFMPCTKTNLDGDSVQFTINTKCELPLTDKGDLRAQWYDECIGSQCDPAKKSMYTVNWPYLFKTYTPPCCDSELKLLDSERFDLNGQDPVPLLVASEASIKTRVLPAIPATYTQVPVIETQTVYQTTEVFNFDYANIAPSSSFVWNSGTKDYLSYETNLNSSNGSLWFTPPQFGSNSGILQGKGYLVSQPIVVNQEVSPYALYCVEQVIDSSRIIAIANVITESQNMLYYGGGDNNINFYSNMVSKNANGNSSIAQLGGWTGRSSFKDAYDKSILLEIFNNTGNEVYLNVINLSPVHDVCWIANPTGLPSEYELNSIKQWLALGNKKLVITRDNTQEKVILVDQILALLNTNIKALFLDVKDKYASVIAGNLTLNQSHYISTGFGSYPISEFLVSNYAETIPFAPNQNIVNVAYYPQIIYDDKIVSDSYFRVYPGVDRVVFPAIPGSGYSLFIDYVSDSNSETVPINIYVGNVSKRIGLPFPSKTGFTSVIPDLDNINPNNPPFAIDAGEIMQIYSTSKNKPSTINVNVQTLENKNTIEVYFHSLEYRINNTSITPKTPKILSISGVLLPIVSSTSKRGQTITNVVGWNTVKVNDAVPETTIIDYIDGPISSLNDKYCAKDCLELGLGNQLIQDGPVVASQEVESISTFNAGVARSRITVISDSNLVQGRFMVDEFGRISSETVSFIRSLYPETAFPANHSGRQYDTFTKLVSPERGSPQKYYRLKGKYGSISRFGFGGSAPLSSYDDKESRFDPNYVVREDPPWTDEFDEKKIKQLKELAISDFIEEEIMSAGGSPKFSGIIDGTPYADVGISGGMPQIMKDTNHDYLDFDYFGSGFPGDLFGFSIALCKNKLVVGSPFSAFSDDTVHPWSYYVYNNGTSGIEISSNGGAGSVYIFEKTNSGSGIRNTITPWEFTSKLRPNNINVGQDLVDSGISQSYLSLGPNSYSSGNLVEWTSYGDQFGYDVSIDSDIIAVGSPGHDFNKATDNVYDSGCFIRKCFNDEFDIPQRILIDFGNSGVRNNLQSGVCVLNNGAIFMFENSINDWTSRSQKWKLIEKITQQGSNTMEQNTNENDFFGRSVSIDRSLRSDADYTVVGGSENHSYSSSGDSLVISAGAAYTNDIMLRESSPAIPNPDCYIDIKVFGERSLQQEPTVRTITNNSLLDQTYFVSGLIYSDNNGNIFFEVSGQDPSVKGFIQHRPYLVSIDGLYRYGFPSSGSMPLYVKGNVDKSENIDLFIAATTGNVYNSLGLYSSSIVDFGSGNLNFYTDCPDPSYIFESGLPLFTASGIGLSTEPLNMRVRGY